MKYYKFGRRRKSTFYGYDPKSKDKSDYMINTGRSRVLDSGYYQNQVWGALHKAWKGFNIAKNKGEDDKLDRYARIIQECQDDLGLQVTSFPDIGKSALAFHSLRAAQIAERNKNSSNDYNHRQEQQEVSDEEYDYQYEQDRLTDDNAYSEYFRDDYNEADRFAS